MISEFNVHTEVSKVEALDAPPVRKARLLLRIGRRARRAALRLAALSRHHYRLDDPLCAARFREAAQRLLGAYADIRERARRALGSAAGAAS